MASKMTMKHLKIMLFLFILPMVLISGCMSTEEKDKTQGSEPIPKEALEEMKYCPKLSDTGQIQPRPHRTDTLMVVLPAPQEQLRQPWKIINYSEGGFPCRHASKAGENVDYVYCRSYIFRDLIVDNSGFILYPEKILVRINSVYNIKTGDLISYKCCSRDLKNYDTLNWEAYIYDLEVDFDGETDLTRYPECKW